MPVYIRKWTEEEKTRMQIVGDKVMDLMKKELKNDFAMIAQIMAFIKQAYDDEVGLERIRLMDKNHKLDTMQEETWVRKIVEGMKKSGLNIVLFRDCPEVWMQFYMGLFLKKETAVIIERGDTKNIDRLTHYGVHLGLVDDFSKSELRRIMEQIHKEIYGGEECGSKRSSEDKS
jgi:hypothetical protein